MKKWFLFFTLFFVMVNIAVPSSVKGLDYFGDTTTEVEEVEKEILTTPISTTFSIIVFDFDILTALPVYIPTYLFKIFIPPSL